MSSPLEVQNKATMHITTPLVPSLIPTSALLYYDYAITWPREVQHFWICKFSFATALYFICRYGMVSNVIYALALAEKLPMMRGYRLAAIVACIGRIAIVLVWGLRTYAISNRNICVLTIFGLFGSSVIGLAILHVPYAACNGYRGTPPGTQETTVAQLRCLFTDAVIPLSSVPYLLPIFTVIFETSAVVFTTGRTLKALAVDNTSWRDAKRGLPFLIFKHGGLSVSSLSWRFSPQSASLACYLKLRDNSYDLHSGPSACCSGCVSWPHCDIPRRLDTPLQEGFFIQRLLNAHTLPLSGLMTARFLLHLRVWSHRQSTNTFVETPSVVLFKKIRADAQTGCSARASCVMRSIVDEFGEDPVVQAHQRAVSKGDVEDIERAERHAEVENTT
ncbi:unnamed protein product [Cyclocybe aegerita]|uniref:DUF6533 domain-containing protein n=1 Tax=Cyclocybe aegerita TaxID=1973307 RepID=A0A8S0WAD3_CYCAE|nr:unnamed protein product [Cyclocybe aegerita]